MEVAIAHGFDHIRVQHEIKDVVTWYDDALIACESLGFTDLEKPFDLVCRSANGLDFSRLVD